MSQQQELAQRLVSLEYKHIQLDEACVKTSEDHLAKDKKTKDQIDNLARALDSQEAEILKAISLAQSSVINPEELQQLHLKNNDNTYRISKLEGDIVQLRDLWEDKVDNMENEIMTKINSRMLPISPADDPSFIERNSWIDGKLAELDKRTGNIENFTRKTELETKEIVDEINNLKMRVPDNPYEELDAHTARKIKALDEKNFLDDVVPRKSRNTPQESKYFSSMGLTPIPKNEDYKQEVSNFADEAYEEFIESDDMKQLYDELIGDGEYDKFAANVLKGKAIKLSKDLPDNLIEKINELDQEQIIGLIDMMKVIIQNPRCYLQNWLAHINTLHEVYKNMVGEGAAPQGLHGIALLCCSDKGRSLDWYLENFKSEIVFKASLEIMDELLSRTPFKDIYRSMNSAMCDGMSRALDLNISARHKVGRKILVWENKFTPEFKETAIEYLNSLKKLGLKSSITNEINRANSIINNFLIQGVNKDDLLDAQDVILTTQGQPPLIKDISYKIIDQYRKAATEVNKIVVYQAEFGKVSLAENNFRKYKKKSIGDPEFSNPAEDNIEGMIDANPFEEQLRATQARKFNLPEDRQSFASIAKTVPASPGMYTGPKFTGRRK